MGRRDIVIGRGREGRKEGRKRRRRRRRGNIESKERKREV